MNIVFSTISFINNKLCNILINQPTLIVRMFVLKKLTLNFFPIHEINLAWKKGGKNDMLTIRE
jgi:hypothetical protein